MVKTESARIAIGTTTMEEATTTTDPAEDQTGTDPVTDKLGVVGILITMVAIAQKRVIVIRHLAMTGFQIVLQIHTMMVPPAPAIMHLPQVDQTEAEESTVNMKDLHQDTPHKHLTLRHKQKLRRKPRRHQKIHAAKR